MFEPASSLLELPHKVYNCMHYSANDMLEVHSDSVAQGPTTQRSIKSMARATNRKPGVMRKRKAQLQKEEVSTGAGVISLGIDDRTEKDQIKILNV